MSMTNRIDEISTPSNAKWQSRKNAAMARGESNLAPVFVDRAAGSRVWDVEGKEYIDFGTGIAVCNTGHVHPAVRSAVDKQLDRFSHTCVMVTPYDSAVELAEKLNAIAPGTTPKKTMFVTTGAEAVENAIKIARSHTGRRGVISFDGSYHGRTLMTMGLTGKMAPYKSGFGPFPADIYRAPFPIDYHGIDTDQALTVVRTILKTDLDPADCAAIIVEPVQGEGGFYPASDAFLQGLRDICDTHGIILIADEIQTGFGRTGRMFCSEYSGVEPDLMTVAKGLAGGFPLAGVVGKADIMDAPGPGGLGGTYAGSPVGCAAALAVIDIIEQDKLCDRAAALGAAFQSRLQELQQEFPNLVGDVRADRGAMAAIELVEDGDAARPNAALTKALVTPAYENGLMILTCGFHGNVVRFLPALTMDDDTFAQGMKIFCDTFRAVTKEIG
ncbi:MAG: 4-aminobutyrate--2-oxoglutarate transaminase [Pseudomonadota bacterium]